MVSEKKKGNDNSNKIESLIQAGKTAVQLGLVVGSGGNLSSLIPGENAFWITGTGTQLDRLNRSSFAKVGLDGKLLSNAIKPSSEYQVHLAAYQSRSDITTCIHLHPQISVLLYALGLEIKFLTVDHVYYLRKVISIPWMQPGSKEIGDAVFDGLKSCNIIILENHGCVVVGSGIDLALSRAVNLEEAAELTLRSQILGIDPKPVPNKYWENLEKKGL